MSAVRSSPSSASVASWDADRIGLAGPGTLELGDPDMRTRLPTAVPAASNAPLERSAPRGDRETRLPSLDARGRAARPARPRAHGLWLWVLRRQGEPAAGSDGACSSKPWDG